jgi:hypothetical protein
LPTWAFECNFLEAFGYSASTMSPVVAAARNHHRLSLTSANYNCRCNGLVVQVSSWKLLALMALIAIGTSAPMRALSGPSELDRHVRLTMEIASALRLQFVIESPSS